MDPILSVIGILLICGVIAGFIAGFLGVGGGFLMVPVMFFLLSNLGYQNNAMVISVATSSAVILFTSISGTIRQIKKKPINWNSAIILGAGGIAGSFIGSSVSVIIPENVHVILFSSFLLFLVFWMSINRSPYLARFRLVESNLLFGFFGILIGIAAGMFGIGGGIILTPVLTTFFGYSMNRSIGISLATMILIAGGSCTSYILLGWGKISSIPYSLGYVNLFFAMVLLCASIPAAQAGVVMSHRISEKILRIVFIGMLLSIAIKMILSVSGMM
jgi:uncharacterized membrane protein YfcA